MESNGLITIQEAARRLQVRRETISDLLEAHGIATRSIPFSPGKGIDPEGFAKLKVLLNAHEEESSLSASKL